MIAQIKGLVLETTERTVVVDVGNVGYEVFVTRDLASSVKIGNQLILFTHFNVREDVQELFGFKDVTELRFFKMLLSVSGIGPRSALNIIDTAKVVDIKRAVANDDALSLHRIHGIGKKTAERLVTELKDKLDIADSKDAVGDEASLVEAIVGLGYSLAEARNAIKEISGQGQTLSERIKLALKYLGRQ